MTIIQDNFVGAGGNNLNSNPYFLSKEDNMLKSYFKLAYRNLIKHKLSSFINITGLAVAIACSIIFFLLLDMEYTSDRFHDNVKKIFMVGYTLEGDGESRRWGDSFLALAPALEAEFPQVESHVRVADRSATVRHDNLIFAETVRFVDPNFLEFFTFPLAQGEKTALNEINGLVLSEQSAIKYFGEENPIGQQLDISFAKLPPEPFTVLGVAKKFPHNASFSFGILASLKKYETLLPQERDNWATPITASFIQVHNPHDIESIAAQTGKFIERWNDSHFGRPAASFVFEPLATLSWESQEIERSVSSGSTPQALILLFVIGLFLLVQACFNYVNIALASGSRRHKEIGIRKVVGCQRSQLVSQFLGENLLMCCVALLIGLLLVEFLFLPGLMGIMGNVEKLSLIELAGSWHLWLFLVLLLIITGIGAGAYPAVVISRLQPVSIMKAKLRQGGKRRFTGFLLSFQFGIAFVIICLVVAFLQNNRYQQQRDWGYGQEHVINIQLEKGEQYGVLQNVLAQNPNAIQAAGSKHAVGRFGEQAVIEYQGEKHEVVRLDTGSRYLETLGMTLIEGRLFQEDLLTDRDTAVVMNTQFLREMGWSTGVGRAVRFDNKLYTVVGVIQDFHHEFFFEEIKPTFFRLVPEEEFRILAVRVEPGSGV